MVNAKLPFVIGAGLGRTGTLSLYGALNQLGYKAFHMKSLEDSGPNTWFEWAKAKRANDATADELAMVIARRVRDNFNATTDFPACLLYKEFMEIEPDAKVILSIRTSGEAWADSVLSTIGKMPQAVCRKAPFKFMSFFNGMTEDLLPLIWETVGVSPFGTWDCTKQLDRDVLIKVHDDWIEQIKATVPKDKLLIHKSADGFGPICKHLGITSEKCPKEYPRLNDKESFGKMIKHMSMLPYYFWGFVSIVGLILFYFVRRFMSKKEKLKST